MALSAILATLDGQSTKTYAKLSELLTTLIHVNDLTRSDLSSATIDDDVDWIRTTGYSTTGDGGGGLHVRTGSQPFHDGWVQSADGAYWELKPEEGYVYDAQFGVVGDDVTDDTLALRKAIHYVTHNTAKGAPAECALGLVRENIYCSGPIHWLYGDGFGGITVRSVRKPFRQSGAQAGTTIRSGVTNGAAHYIDGARTAIFENILFTGRAVSELTDVDPTDGSTWRQEATWRTALASAGYTNVSPTTKERYAPRALFAIDGYNKTAPTAGTGTNPYPDPTSYLPSYITATTNGYSRSASSRVVFIECGFAGAECAVASSPQQGGDQGDFVGFVRCLIENCLVGVSYGQAQGRTGPFDLQVSNVFRIIATGEHGDQQGKIAGRVNISGGSIVNVFNLGTTANTGVLTINIQGEIEGVHRLGDCGAGGSSTSPIVFEGGGISFRHKLYKDFPPNVLQMNGNRRLVKFRDINMDGFGEGLNFGDSLVEFDNVFTNGDTPDSTAKYVFHNGTCGGMVAPFDEGANFRHRLVVQPYNIDTGAAGSTQTTGVNYRQTNREHCIPLWAFDGWWHSQNVGTGYMKGAVPRAHVPYSDTAADIFSSYSRTDRTISTTWSGLNDNLARDLGGQLGDVVVAQADGTTFRVDARSGTSVDLYMVTGIYSDDDGTTWSLHEEQTFDFATGSCDVASLNVYAIREPIFADSTAANTDLTNLRTTQTAVATVMADVTANDQLKGPPIEGVPDTNRSDLVVSTVDTGTPKFVMNGNMDNAVSAFPLRCFARITT